MSGTSVRVLLATDITKTSAASIQQTGIADSWLLAEHDQGDLHEIVDSMYLIIRLIGQIDDGDHAG